MKTVKLLKFSIVTFLFLSLLQLFSITYADVLDVISGHVFLSRMSTTMNTQRWAGLKGTTSGTMDESNLPFWSYSFVTPTIAEVTFPGTNFMDNKHYYAAFPENVTFNLTKVRNITYSDLESNGLFNSTSFPIFHPNYDNLSDNPKNTFCCNQEPVMIGGETFNSYYTYLNNGVKYYLLKYEINETYKIPFFLVKIGTYTCYDSTSCNFEFMLPINKTYYFYILSKEPPYKLDVWIDGVKTTTFSNTALPYNVTVRLTNLYTGEPVVKTIAVYELEGNNLFILPLNSGMYMSRAFGMGEPRSDGYKEFIVAPTKYQSPDEYKIAVAVIDGTNYIIKKELKLSVSSTTITYVKKTSSQHISPYLTDLKDGVNWLRPIANCLFKYASSLKRASRITINGAGTYTVIRGVPYIIDVTDSSASFIELEEKNGYLVMMPAHKLNLWNFTHIVFNTTNNDIIMTPTLDGGETFNAKIYDSSYSLLYTVTFNVYESTCYDPSSWESYDNQKLKDAVNSVRPVLNSLYYSVN